MSQVPKPTWMTDLKDLSPRYFRLAVEKIYTWWNDHDAGVSRWTQVSTGGFSSVVTSYASSPTLTDDNQIVLVDSTAAARTVNLPTAVGRSGRRFTIKDWKGQSGTNNITIDGSGTETIDGATTKVLNVAYQSYTIISDGANWSII